MKCEIYLPEMVKLKCDSCCCTNQNDYDSYCWMDGIWGKTISMIIIIIIIIIRQVIIWGRLDHKALSYGFNSFKSIVIIL